jgi:cell wall-associated NlpC family hydrolase
MRRLLGRAALAWVVVTAPSVAGGTAARAAGTPPATAGQPTVANSLQRLQTLLGVPPSGLLDRRTVRAVRAFQSAHGLEVDGVPGPLTWAALDAEYAGRPGDRVFRHGDRGHVISSLQWALGLPATGRYGLATRSAVRRFQRSHGLVVDGEAGPRTQQALVDEGILPEGSFGHPRRRRPPPDTAIGHSAPVETATADLGRRAATLSLQFLGRPYVWGGEDPRGFDCSGLVQYVYGRLGVPLPRVARDQYDAGVHVPFSQLEPGDLVFFENLGHVGIYLGHGRFVHAPHTGTVVQIAELDGWYADNYVGAVRVGASAGGG